MKKVILTLLSVFVLVFSVGDTFATFWSYQLGTHDGSPSISTSYKYLTIKGHNIKGCTKFVIQKLSGGKWVPIPKKSYSLSGNKTFAATLQVDSKYTQYRVLVKHMGEIVPTYKSWSQGTISYQGHNS